VGYLTSAQRFDAVCVGDVATDIFVRLAEGAVEERADERGRWLEIPLGAKVPFDRGTTVAAGGSAANAAIALARLNLRVALASFLAHDAIGFDLLGALHGEHVDTRLVHLDEPAHTNRNFVLSYHGHRTILVHHEEFDYHWPHLRPNEVPAWLYLSSVGRETHAYEEQIADFLDENPTVELAFQPGTYQLEEGPQVLRRLYERASLLVCNVEEAARISGLSSSAGTGALLDALRALGPRRVVVTDSVAGAFAREDGRVLEVPVYPDPGPVVDRTGAGDAFAATLTACLVRGMDLEESLLRAPVNAASVVQQVGTQQGLLRQVELDAYLASAPDSFAVRSVPALTVPAARK